PPDREARAVDPTPMDRGGDRARPRGRLGAEPARRGGRASGRPRARRARGHDPRDLPPARVSEPAPRTAPRGDRRGGGPGGEGDDVARGVADLPRIRADLYDRGERLRDDGRARVPARARRRPGRAGLPRPALRHAVLGRRRDGGGDAALPRAHDRVGPRGGCPDGGGVRRAHGLPRPDRVRRGRQDRQAGAERGPAAAARAVETKVARPLGLALEDAAWGIHAIVNTNMELATRVVSIERGRDPRDLTLVAFGGSGPVHGCRLAQALSIPRVILPAAAGVTAAIGLLAAEVRFDVARTYVRRLDAVEPAQLGRMYAV